METNKKQGLAPLLCPEPRTLILGSLPSDESIRRQEYYGNPQNRFWKVLSGVYGDDVPETYADKKAFLAKHHIALWDVFESAHREGSLDANIQNPVRNDIFGFIWERPTIRTVVLNGGKAAAAFRRIKKENSSSCDIDILVTWTKSRMICRKILLGGQKVGCRSKSQAQASPSKLGAVVDL